MVRSETESDVVRVETLITGNAAAEVIAESETPRHMVFQTGDGHDFHVRTQVVFENTSDRALTESVTVSLSEGETTRGQTLLSSTQEVSLDPDQVTTLDFNTGELRFSARTYQIEVEPAGNAPVPIEVVATREFTRPAAYTWTINSGGDLELTSHTGRPSLRVDGMDGTVAFPSGQAVSSAPLQVGEDIQQRFVETATPSDPAAIVESGDPTSVMFQSGDGIDAHERVVVTVENQTESKQSGYISVDLVRLSGGDGGSVIDGVTEWLSLSAGQEATRSYLERSIPLADGEYLVEVSAPTGMTVTQTQVETRGAAYRWQQTDSGTLEVVDHNDEPFASYPLQSSDPVAFPPGVSTQATTYDTTQGDPTTDDLDPGEAMTYLSDGSSTGAAGDLVYAYNDNGTILTTVMVARTSAN